MNNNSKPSHHWMTKVVLLLAANVALMAGSSLAPAMPAMLSEFEAVSGAKFWVSMILTLPALFVVIGGPITGYLTDRLGRKPVFVFSILLCGLSGGAGYFLSSIRDILISRALVGLSMAGATTATNSLIADYFSGHQRSRFMGYFSAGTGLSGVVFVLIGGALAEINWHYAFLSYFSMLILFPFAIIFIREPEAIARRKEDTPSAKLQLDVTKGYIFLAIFLMQVTFLTIPVYIAYHMTGLLGTSSFEVGLVSAGTSLASFFGGLVFASLSKRFGYRDLSIVTFFVFGVGFLALGLGQSWFLVFLGQWVVGFCLGIATANLMTWLSNRVATNVRGRANGVFVTMMYLGNFSTSLVFTPLINKLGYQAAYLVSAVVMVGTGLIGLLVERNGKEVTCDE